MALGDNRIDQLMSLIGDSFRVRENHDPLYVDLGGHLGRISASQHQILFGRRGSGKSSLMVHFHRRAKSRGGALSVYLSADEVKRLDYPDVLIRLLVTLLERLRKEVFPWYRRLTPLSRRVSSQIRELRELLDKPGTATIVQQHQTDTREHLTSNVTTPVAGYKATLGSNRTEGRQSSFVAHKLDELERHLQDFKEVLRETVQYCNHTKAVFMIDDFYLVHRDVQPDVLDYLHRLTRGIDVYLKIGAIRHRTALVRHDGQTIGVELSQDVEPIDLDRTLEDMESTKNYLGQMLDELGKRVGITKITEEFLNPDALFALTLASGGVPRDFLTIFVEAVKASRSGGEEKWLTPKPIYKGAARVSYNTKLNNLRGDLGTDSVALELVFVDLIDFCLQEKKKTVFLVSQEDARRHEDMHELIKQLMDFKLIHVIEPDTSAASGRPGRFEAYTLDAALFMEPRRRGIEIVSFWEFDDQHRRRGVREAPVYDLGRARVITQTHKTVAEGDTEAAVKRIVDSAGEAIEDTKGSEVVGKLGDW